MIANDVTVQSGSFGVQEDDFFFKASVYARERGTEHDCRISHPASRYRIIFYYLQCSVICIAMYCILSRIVLFHIM